MGYEGAQGAQGLNLQTDIRRHQLANAPETNNFIHNDSILTRITEEVVREGAQRNYTVQVQHPGGHVSIVWRDGRS
jgi:hypothetical protein